MVGFLGGFAQGLNSVGSSRGNSGGMTDYQAARIQQQQQTTNAQIDSAKASQNLNEARLVEQNMENKALKLSQEYEAGEIQAASVGGVAAAIEYANKSGHFERAAEIQKQQNDLNTQIAETTKLTTKNDREQLALYADRQKQLGGIGALFFKDIQSGANAQEIYEKQYYPAIKQILPNAPKEYGPDVDSMLKIAVGQSLQQNSNYSRMTEAQKNLIAYRTAIQTGDKEGAAFLLGQLQKMSMFVNQQTGDVYNLWGDAPDGFQGSQDTKANAVGLGAGSTIPPIEGAVFRNQPMNSGIQRDQQNYDRENGITQQNRVIRNMKSAQGYNIIVKPDGTQEMKPIVGGPADKPRSNVSEAVRLQSLQTGQKAFNQYYDILVDPTTGKVKPSSMSILGTINQAKLRDVAGTGVTGFLVNSLISTDAQKLKALGDNMIEGILRGQSGATININERPRFEQELLPQPGDDADVIKTKLQITHEILNGSLDIIKKGVGGAEAVDKSGNAVVDWDIVHNAVKYATNGGSVFDITRGDGAKPEKARQNQLKKLSYNPQEIQYYMSPENNGQGRELTEDEAKQLIDQIKANQQQGGNR